MNTLASPPHLARRHSADDRSTVRPRREASPRRKRLPLGGPVAWWAVVMVLALFSSYVYVLQEQVLRGEQTRQAHRSGQQEATLRTASHSASRDVDTGGDAFDLMMPPALQLRLGASR